MLEESESVPVLLTAPDAELGTLKEADREEWPLPDPILLRFTLELLWMAVDVGAGLTLRSSVSPSLDVPAALEFREPEPEVGGTCGLFPRL